jgi:DNA repair exonuclease SbcCD nuclease subunit
MNIIIGDPHITKKNLQESKDFFNHILEQCRKNIKKNTKIIILGDGQHTHAVINMETQNYWDSLFESIENEPSILEAIYLIGNHDVGGEKSKEREESSFKVFKNKYSKIKIIDKPAIEDGIAYVPYTSCEETFIKDCKNLYKKGAKNTVICHQTFNGAKYETGMYAPEGFDHTKVPQKNIISGHIHTTQAFDKVYYPGTWRWMTKADANSKKCYILCEDLDIEKPIFEPVYTENICTPIKEYVIEEGTKLPKLNSRNKNYITLKGSAQWANITKKKIKDQAIIKIITTDKKVQRVEIGENINIDKFINDHISLEKEVTKQEVIDYIGSL